MFIAWLTVGMVSASLVLALCAIAGEDPLEPMTPGLWIVEIDDAGDIAAAEPLDDRRRP